MSLTPVEGKRVVLKSFCGEQTGPAGTIPAENYWLLIGRWGRIVRPGSQASLLAGFSVEPRLLIRFDDSVAGLGLEAHNEIPHALWILVSDLAEV